MWAWMAETPKKCCLCGYRLRQGNFLPTCGFCYDLWSRATCARQQQQQQWYGNWGYSKEGYDESKHGEGGGQASASKKFKKSDAADRSEQEAEDSEGESAKGKGGKGKAKGKSGKGKGKLGKNKTGEQ